MMTSLLRRFAGVLVSFVLFPTVVFASLESGTVIFENADTPPFYFKAAVSYEVFAPGDATSPVPSATDFTYVYTLTNQAATPPAGSFNVPVDRLDVGVGASASVTATTSLGVGIAPSSIDATTSASRVQFLFASGINPGQSSNQLVIQSPNGPGDTGSNVAFGTFIDGRILRAPFTLPAKDFACYDVNKAEFKIYRNKSGKDKLELQKGAISFAAGDAFDPATDIVKLDLNNGDFVLSIPAGSFERKGSKADYKYETGSGVVPEVKFRLNIDKAEWSVKVKKADFGLFLDAAGMDVTLMIGDVKGRTSVPLTIKEDDGNEQKLEFKRSPRFECPKLRDDDSSAANDTTGHGHHKRSCMSSFTVTYRLGQPDQEVIALFGGDIGHPDTAVISSAGPSATFHTSCSVCLSCGQTDASGDFTITGISDATGKMMSQCGGVDPSCDITPDP